MAGGTGTTIPLINDGDQGLIVRQNVLNEMVNRWNSAGFYPTGIRYLQTNPGYIIQSTVVETSLIPATGSGVLLFPANSISEDCQLRIKISGVYSNTGVTNRIKVKFTSGAGTVILVNKNTTGWKNGTNIHYDLECILSFENPGSGMFCYATGKLSISQGDANSPIIWEMVNSTPGTPGMIDSTLPQTIDVTCQPSATTGGNSISIFQASIEKLTLR